MNLSLPNPLTLARVESNLRSVMMRPALERCA